MTTGKVPPNATDEERAVLSACMLSREALDSAMAILRPEHFYVAAHGLIFGACCAVAEQGRPVDVTTIARHLRDTGDMKKAGDVAYLGKLVDETPSVANVVEHARIVWSKWQRRTVLASLHKLVADGYDAIGDEEYLTRVDSAVTAALSHSLTTDGPRVLKDVLAASVKAIKETAERGVIAVSSGLADLDEELDGGGRPGELIVIAGRPGMGKSSLLQQWLISAATERDRGLWGWSYGASLEMRGEQIGGRLLASRSGINGRILRRGALSQEDWGAVAAAGRDLARLPVWLADKASTMVRIAAEARQLQRKAQAAGSRLAAIGIDYLQIIDTPQAENYEREIATITRAAKLLSLELEVPVFLLSQLNRGVETRGKDKRPTMADLKASGAIEADADIVLFVYRDEVYNPNSPDAGIAEIIIAKNRDGDARTVRTRFVNACTRFENLSGSEPYMTPEALGQWSDQ